MLLLIPVCKFEQAEEAEIVSFLLNYQLIQLKQFSIRNIFS